MKNDFYNKVFDLLKSIGGADEFMRADFVYHHAIDPICDEYRFQGKIGFGGKYRRQRNSVDCYREDETHEIHQIVIDLNKALMLLKQNEK